MYRINFTDEQGMASVLGVFLLFVLMFLGTALFCFSHSEYQITQRFLSGTQLRMAAENGIIAGCELLAADKELCAEIVRMHKETRHLLSREDKSMQTYCDVYAVYENEAILVLAISERKQLHGRASGSMKRNGENYIFDHWER
jgi:hypothetical protein